MARLREASLKNSSNSGTIPVTLFLSRLTSFLKIEWLPLLELSKTVHHFDQPKCTGMRSLLLLWWSLECHTKILGHLRSVLEQSTELLPNRPSLLPFSALRRKGRLEAFQWKRATYWTTCRERCRALLEEIFETDRFLSENLSKCRTSRCLEKDRRTLFKMTTWHL